MSLFFLLAFTGITLVFMDQVMPAVRWITALPNPHTIETIYEAEPSLADVIQQFQKHRPKNSISAVAGHGKKMLSGSGQAMKCIPMIGSVYIQPNTGETIFLINHYHYSPASAYARSW